MVTLSEELGFMQAYLFLHEGRLGSCIVCKETIPDEYKESLLPPLTLQLLIENVIKHNSISQSRPMIINIWIEENLLCVSNPVIPKKSNSELGMGLQNLSNRCKLMSGKGIEIINENKIFTVKVPLSL